MEGAIRTAIAIKRYCDLYQQVGIGIVVGIVIGIAIALSFSSRPQPRHCPGNQLF